MWFHSSVVPCKRRAKTPRSAAAAPALAVSLPHSNFFKRIEIPHFLSWKYPIVGHREFVRIRTVAQREARAREGTRISSHKIPCTNMLVFIYGPCKRRARAPWSAAAAPAFAASLPHPNFFKRIELSKFLSRRYATVGYRKLSPM